MLFNSSIGQNVKMVDLPGTEVAFLISPQSNNFNLHYLFQYDGAIFNVQNASNIGFLSYTATTLKISYANKIYTFTVDKTYQNASEIVYYGNGLARRIGPYKIAITNDEIESIDDIINSSGTNVPFAMFCTSGGQGSSSCAIDEDFPWHQHCDVSCGAGYYACCDANTVRCKCIGLKKLKKNPKYSS